MRKAKNYKNIKDTLETVILDISRVSRVTAGGKRLSFRVTLIVGDKSNFRVGLGIGKGKDVAQAIEKATAANTEVLKNTVKPIWQGNDEMIRKLSGLL